MSGPAFFQRCTACSTVFFPPRLACRACGGAAFEQVEAGPGVVEEVTELPDGLRIASVRARGVPVVCSTSSESSAVEVGSSVALVDSPPEQGGQPAHPVHAVHLPGSARVEPAAFFTTTHIENEGTP
ncbi:zinc ribbon domain-containing protein [Herbiconiux sp.]|uniref:Zn-ribbon domain-containing OB-fold protein n=1 Tax=Herbiconiux sp. TaxID=1871186 RepID=UPI0025BF1B7E|nr:zinc ribbon domain-containing protein [Herbiconiux sp.]